MTKRKSDAARLSRLLAVAALAFVCASPLSAAQAPLAPARAPAGAFPEALRPVAHIVGPTWGEDRQRDAAREVEQIAARLHIKSGQSIGDLGAGTGYDSLRLARLVGPGGRVIAEDIDPAYLQALAARAAQAKLTNVVIALGAPQDPRLPAASLDAAILVHMYHEIAHPYAFLYNLAPALKPGARVGVEELDRPTAAHGTPPSLLRCEFAAVGYRLVGSAPLKGGLGYFAVFEAPSVRPQPQQIRACRA